MYIIGFDILQWFVCLMRKIEKIQFYFLSASNIYSQQRTKYDCISLIDANLKTHSSMKILYLYLQVQNCLKSYEKHVKTYGYKSWCENTSYSCWCDYIFPYVCLCNIILKISLFAILRIIQLLIKHFWCS